MSLYRYRAMTASGRCVSGRMRAANLADVEMRLKRMGLDFIRGTPTQPRAWFGTRVPRRELINLFFHLEQLIRAGIPLVEALVDLRDTIEDRPLRLTVTALVDDIEGGKTLSQAMEEHPAVFDEVTVHLVRAGESTGCLPEIFAELVTSLKWQDELAAQTRRLAVYPLFLGVLLTALTFFMMIFLVPKMVGFMRSMGQELPLHTQLLIAVSAFFVAYWYVLLGVPLVAAAGLRFAAGTSPRVRLALDAIKLRLPIVGAILRKIVLARFAGSFAMMYGSGISVLDAMRAGEKIAGNAVIAAGLRRVGDLISDGAGVAAAFESAGTFPPLVIRMLHVGENSGALDRALNNVGYFFSRDVRESVERLQALVEPVMTVIIGLVMGWIMLAVLGPIYDTVARLKV